MLRSCFVCLFASVLSGCSPDPKNCWAPETKTSTTSLFRDIAKKRFIEMARKSIGRRFTDEDKEKFEEGVQLSLNEFYAISSDHAAEALRCGANMKISWTRSDGKVFTARDRLVEFNIYRAEGPGKVVFVTNESGSIAQTLETMFAD